VEDRTKMVLDNEISHIQIHNEQFLENNEPRYTLSDKGFIDSLLKNTAEIKNYTYRTRLTGMANTPAATAGINIIGIDPATEIHVSGLHKTLLANTGNYLEPGSTNKILIGKKLAESLKLTEYIITDSALQLLSKATNDKQMLTVLTLVKDSLFRSEKDFVKMLETKLTKDQLMKHKTAIKNTSVKYKLRNKIIITTQNSQGNLVGGAFRIAGIYNSENALFDAQNVFFLHTDIEILTGYSLCFPHEVAIKLTDIKHSQTVSEVLKPKLENTAVETWKSLQPEIAFYTDFMDFYNLIIIGFILASLAFAIVNTMLMVVLERVKELGMLMAIGMNKRRVFYMIMLETIFLSLTGAVVGMLIAAYAIHHFGQVGLHFSQYAEGFEAMGYKSSVYPAIGLGFYFTVAFLVIITGIVASIYPARKALKLNPADAIRSDI